jgi:hypothetical protein
MERYMNWQPVETAPKDGSPVWLKGNNWGDPQKGIHCTWGWWDGENWIQAGADECTLTHVFEWLPNATTVGLLSA